MRAVTRRQDLKISAPSGTPLEGQPVKLVASSTDPGADPASYQWTVTRNGTPYAAGTGGEWTFTPDDEGAYDVTLTALDDDLGSATTGMTISVENASPSATFKAPTHAVRGQRILFVGSFTDQLDTHEVAWDFGDDTPMIPFRPTSDLTALSPNHIFSKAGTFTVKMFIRDDDGGVTVAEHQVTFAVVGLQVDPRDPNKTVLVIGGTTGADDIHVLPKGSRGEVRVKVNGVDYGVFRPTSAIFIFGQGGDDDIKVNKSVRLPVELSA